MIDWVFLTLVAATLGAFYIWRKKTFSYFKELGIPGPEPSLLFGNLLQIRKQGAAGLFKEWIKKYGNIVGFYNGAVPFLLVNDLEMVKKVQIEDFHNFASRGVVFDVEDMPEVRHKLVVNAPVNRWREMRAVLSPAFTTTKLSKISVIMKDCIDTLMEMLEKKTAGGQSVEATLLFRLATLDTMLKAGYGADLDVQRSPPGGPFEGLATGAVKLLETVPLTGVTFLANCFPETRPFWIFASWLSSRIVLPYIGIITKLLQPVINQRRAEQLKGRVDVLQLLLNKETTGTLFLNEGDAFDGKRKLALTEDEVTANSALYLLAGVEVTPSTIALALYLVATHPEVQERLEEEILGVLKRDGAFMQKNVLEMTYLDMVLNESMRLYTAVVGFVTRRAEKDYEFKGIKIPKGLSVMVAVSSLHHNPEMWDEPEKFDPERFSPQNKSTINPVGFQPFGKGPRECLGRNFATLQMKLTLATVMATYRVSVDEDRHKGPIKTRSTLIASFVPNGVWLKFEKREK
ncbi:cytochrome P450 3A24-like [Haemaphysalis longicornis]